MSINDEMEFRLRSEVDMSLNETEFRLRKAHELNERQEDTIATLRAAMAAAEALLAAAFSGDDYWTANSIPMEAPRGVVRKVRALRAALAAAKETP